VSHKLVIVLIVTVACSATFMACSPTQQQPNPKTADQAAVVPAPATDNTVSPPVAALVAQASACPADQTWLNSATLPSEVPGTKTTCNFEQFAWQSLLALVQPSSDPSVLQFETWMPSYGIFIKDGTPTPWGQQPPITCPTPQKFAKLTGKARRVYSDIMKQAGSDQPLIDLKGEFVYYSMSVNKSAYDMLTTCQLYKANCAGPLKPDNKGIDLIAKYPSLAFPGNAVELKTSWMVLNQTEVDSGLFYVVPGLIQYKDGPCRAVNLGLTGLHIVSKTPSSPALIWATFEHRNNAPDVGSTTAPPPLGGAWNFFNPACTDCTTNAYKASTPAQVVRMHPQGNSSIGTFPGGVDCKADPNQYPCQGEVRKSLDESTQAINAINSSAQQLITANPALINKVWANYELVGNVWTIGGTVPPVLQAQRGALSAANTSMETFVQNGVANVSNPYSCFSCHNMQGPTVDKNLPPVGLSHLFQEIRMPGGCANGSLPATCAPYEK
jgi:hypothetical protein